MKRNKPSNQWKLLALLAAVTIVTAACSPTAAPASPSAAEQSKSGQAEAKTEQPEATEKPQDVAAAALAEPEVQFFGVVESIGADAWTISGQSVAITAQTEVKGALAVGDTLKVHAFVGADGTLTAREIEPAPAGVGEPGMLIEFFGTVEVMAAEAWTIDGQAVLITAQTEIKGAIQIGDRVKVHAAVGADGSVTAREIKPADNAHEVPGVEVEFRGRVQSIGDSEWTVGGVAFGVTAATEIEAGIQAGDFVKVHARRQSDGSLWAREIEREQEREGQGDTIEFFGAVESMGAEAWVVAGQTVKIAADTEIKDAIEVGDFVKVRAVVESDGSLTAREIELDNGGPGGGDDNGNDNQNGNDNSNENENDNANGNANDNQSGDDNANGNANDNQNQNGDDNTNGNANDNQNQNGDDNTNGNANDNQNQNGDDNTNGNANDNQNQNGDDNTNGNANDNQNQNGDDNTNGNANDNGNSNG